MQLHASRSLAGWTISRLHANEPGPGPDRSLVPSFSFLHSGGGADRDNLISKTQPLLQNRRADFSHTPELIMSRCDFQNTRTILVYYDHVLNFD